MIRGQTANAKLFNIPQEAREAFLRLLFDDGIVQAPCTQDMELWWSFDQHEQDAAAKACLSCPALLACREYAITAGEKQGVWGGMTPRQRLPFIADAERDRRNALRRARAAQIREEEREAANEQA